MNREIDKLAWLYIREGKILSARSKNKELFYIPGGKREKGESDEEHSYEKLKKKYRLI
ncbi:MAG: hypothetical protein ACJAZQ_002039 [Cognaticolwellia sp.]